MKNDEAIRAVAVIDFQRYGVEVREAKTADEVRAAVDRYEQRKRDLWRL